VSTPQRLAVIFDAAEELWPSMDYAAEMLLAHLQREHADRLTTVGVRPHFFGGFEALQLLPERLAWNLDRLVTRFITYPLQLVPRRTAYAFFHIADHTYSALALVLPRGRTGVYCHDLDAFEAALEPAGKPMWRVQMARLQLAGLRSAAVVFFSTQQIRAQIVKRMLVPEDRLVHAPLGVADEFFAPGEGALPPELRGATYLLNVAGNFPRKRLDILFRIFARLRGEFPSLLLVQHGAALDSAQLALLSDLGIADGVVRTPPLSRAGLAALYAHARLVVLTSEREGFGFPVLEALAAGAVVVLSEIPGFRETAADAGVFCVPGDVEGWVDVIRGLLNGSRGAPGLSIRSDRARRFSWTAHAAAVSEAYLRLAAPQ